MGREGKGKFITFVAPFNPGLPLHRALDTVGAYDLGPDYGAQVGCCLG
jgi:hypothetical protein